jgi:hypothetical protein
MVTRPWLIFDIFLYYMYLTRSWVPWWRSRGSSPLPARRRAIPRRLSLGCRRLSAVAQSGRSATAAAQSGRSSPAVGTECSLQLQYPGPARVAQRQCWEQGGPQHQVTTQKNSFFHFYKLFLQSKLFHPSFCASVNISYEPLSWPGSENP